MAKMTEGFKEVNEKVEAGFKDVDKKVEAGFKDVDKKMEAGFKDVNEKMAEGFQRTDRAISTIHQELRMYNAELQVVVDVLVDAGASDLRSKISAKRAEAFDVV